MSNTTVKQLLGRIGYRIDDDPQENEIFISWINDLVQYVGLRLHLLQSDLIQGDLSLSYVVGTNSQMASLPDDFLGLSCRPWIDGETSPINPLPSDEMVPNYSASGTPKYYKVRGERMYLYPPTDTSASLMGFYAQRPDAITKSSDEIPWNGLYDLMIQEAVIDIYKIANPTLDNLDKLQKSALSYLNMVEFKKNIEKVALKRNFSNPRVCVPPRVI